MIKQEKRINIADLDAVLFSFFWLDIQSVRACLAQSVEKEEGCAFSENTDVEPLLNLQYGYSQNPQRAAFFSVGENATIMFPNLQDGWQTLFLYIARGLKARTCYMRIMDDQKIVDAGCYLHYIENSLERVVYVLQEGRWVFYEQGSPFSFENTDYYLNRLKKRRLDKRIMLEYCENLGILKDGVINLDLNGAFSYESHWTGESAGKKAAGPASFVRK